MGGALSGRDLKDPAMTDSKRDDLVVPQAPLRGTFTANCTVDDAYRIGWREGWLAGRESIPHAAEWWNAPGNITAPNGEVFFRRDAVDAIVAERIALLKRVQYAYPDPFGREHADTLRDLDARAAMCLYLSAMVPAKNVPDMSAVATLSFMLADAMATARSAK